MTPERYEYRVVDKNGNEPSQFFDWPERDARRFADHLDSQWPYDAPHRVERRQVTEWEPLPERADTP